MRTIKLGGHEYRIRGSITVHAAAAKRRNALLAAADKEAELEAQNGEIADASELIAEKRAAALTGDEYVAGESLQLLSDLINAAVEYYAVLCGQDISGSVHGGYPMTAQKLCFIATIDELNSKELSEAVAAELLESQGGAASKNLTAQDVVNLTALLMSMDRQRTQRTGQ